MKTPLILLFLLLPLLAMAQPLEPYRHNFFTTNPAPVVDVVAGSNVFVTPTIVGTGTRHFTVDVPGSSAFATNSTLATNSINSTNFWGLLSPTNLPAGLSTSNYVGTFTGNGSGLTNLPTTAIAAGATNQVLTQTGWSGYPQVTNLTLITNGIGTAVVPTLWLKNQSPASLGAQQNSPVIMQEGEGWRSGNSTTMPVAMGWGVVPVQGSSADPTAQYTLFKSINNAVPTSTGIYLGSDGKLIVSADTDNNVILSSGSGSAGAQFQIAKGGRIGSSGAFAGAIYLRRFDSANGIGYDVGNLGWNPSSDNLNPLGNSSFRWKSIDAVTGNFSNLTASATVSATNATFGTLTVSNNLTLTGTLTVSNISASSITGPVTHTFYATNGYTVCTAGKEVYMVNAYTNPLFVLPDASTVSGQEFIFTTTNVACFFIVTNKTGTQTIANGQSLSYTNNNNGQKVTSFISDGAHWWLGRKGKTILPSASWSCNTNITFPNVTNMVTLDTQEANNGVGIALDNSAWFTAGVGSRIWVTNAGMYLLTFSAMWSKVGGGAANGDVWLRQDGAMLPRTMTLQTIQNATTTNVMTVNFILPVTKTTYFDLVGASPDGSAQMQAMPAITTPFARPAAPSMIVTIQKTSD